jgi:hypothetical protein
MSRKSIVPPQNARASTETPFYVPLIGGTATVSDLLVTNDLQVSGDLDVAGDTNLGGNLTMAGTITGATNIVYGQNAYVVDETWIAPAAPAAGFTETVVGTFTPAKAGLYLLSASFGVDTNATDGYTAVPPDSIGWILRPTAPPPYPADSIGSVTMFVYTVAAGAGNDYGGEASTLAKLAAVEYNIIAITDNISGTMAGAAPLSTRIKVATIA